MRIHVHLLWVLSLVTACPCAAAQAPVQSTLRGAVNGRIVGVFDEQSGRAIVGAQVRDLQTGTWASTTETGNVKLSFADTSTVVIRITKVGYQPLILAVNNTPRDTAPLTLLLKPLAPQLAPVIATAVRARGPADTVRKLEVNGFYERRAASGAPLSAFVTSEQLDKLTILSDLAHITGHAICNENLYIDGIKVEVSQLRSPRETGLRGRAVVAPPLKDGIDAILSTRDVLAIELYDVATSPTQFNRTQKPGFRPCGTTLIWTK